MQQNKKQWQFWIDRGGTFTDVIAKTPADELIIHKLLSENPSHYEDAVVQGIKDCLASENIVSDDILMIKLGTTVATNALLERKGEPTLLVTTKGFKDALSIGYQNRPEIFALDIKLPSIIHAEVLEVDERMNATGEIIKPLELNTYREKLEQYYQTGFQSVAIVFMHSYLNASHETAMAQLAADIGFSQISVSHQVSPLPKIITRGDTTVVDAYLSPVLNRYIGDITTTLPKTTLQLMQSNGGLSDAINFHGKDSILSGPAGGVIGMVHTAKTAGFEHVIGFDMGGTSTDVSHYCGEYERVYESTIAGTRLSSPMLNVHTIAAGGGSIVYYQHGRMQVGPESAGAYPGPACYGNGGPLTVTDCNVLLGAIPETALPNVFGKSGKDPINKTIVIQLFASLAKNVNHENNTSLCPYQLAEGFINVAVNNMANAIKKISVQRGFDIQDYVLNCFGAASGQHACLVAEEIGIDKLLIHPFAGGLSALGIGIADQRMMKSLAIEKTLTDERVNELKQQYQQLEKSLQSLFKQNTASLNFNQYVHCRYKGSDTSIELSYEEYDKLLQQFEKKHLRLFGFFDASKRIIISSISVEAISTSENSRYLNNIRIPSVKKTIISHQLFIDGKFVDCPVYQRHDLQHAITGPAIVIEPTNTLVIHKHWQACLLADGQLLLEKTNAKKNETIGTARSPILLEIFNNQFMSIAEQMGVVLRQTAYSVNIKERLDFSCAIFTKEGELVANAPHIPVHLGSMSESVKYIHQQHHHRLKKGDVFMLNSPYCGGTHLPDITVITPVFTEDGKTQLFYVASRGHHADIGGITPGSMPAESHHIEEEGILIEDVQLVRKGIFLEEAVKQLFSSSKYPARNIQQNIADLQAQIAANEKGRLALHHLVGRYGLATTQAYMKFVKDNARESVIQLIPKMKAGAFHCAMDNGNVVAVNITPNNDNTLTIDFSQSKTVNPNSNFNAPVAVVKAAILYILRCLIKANIPLNSGCLDPVNLILNCDFLDPKYPAPVVAGNVETSQVIVDVLFAALGVMAASQGTMNNFTFGNAQYQYYETICGGVGAGIHWPGANAVHTHMTNTRLTDPEILEARFPVRLQSFEIRKDSGGKGQYNGGDGVTRKIQFLEPMSATILSNRRKTKPFGLKGGGAGMPGINYVIRHNGIKEYLGATATVSLDSGDVFVIETPGGGAYQLIQGAISEF